MHIRLFLTIAIALEIVAIQSGPLATSVCATATAFGFGVWTLFEYVAHRGLLHSRVSSPQTTRLARLIHGEHYDLPDNPGRLPTSIALLWTVAIWAAASASVGALADPWMAGILAGYVRYDVIHTRIHARQAFRTRWGRRLQQRHALHHFVDSDRFFAVSTPFWDTVFGTGSPRAQNR
jgi:sterol desaturase/sphingolipid hydroxylase (fatty acid hydroxylase superfamily)